jgi:hypothetical protein
LRKWKSGKWLWVRQWERGTRKWKMNTCIEEDTRGGFFCIVLLFCFIIIVMAHSLCKFGFVNFIVWPFSSLF